MAVLKIKDEEGNVHEILTIKGDKGDNYILTDADKREIAEMVASLVTTELMSVDTPSGEEVSY